MINRIKDFFKLLKRFGTNNNYHIPEKIDVIIYLKAPPAYKMCLNLERLINDENTLVVMDDQFDFSSKVISKYFIKVKIEPSIINFFRYLNNPSQISVDFLRLILEDNESKVRFINFNDHDETTIQIINQLDDFFISKYTIQHGLVTDIDGYFPFNSDVFFAFSKNDLNLAKKFLRKCQKIIVAGNLMLNISSLGEQYKADLLDKLDNNSYKLLIATDFKVINNLRLIYYSTFYKQAKITFKPHPSDKLQFLYRVYIFYLNRIRKNSIIIIKDVEEYNSYDFLLTNHSSLIFESLIHHVLPIIISDYYRSSSPYYINNSLFSERGTYNLHDIIKYYKENIDSVLDYINEYSGVDNLQKPNRIIEDYIKNRIQ